MTASHDELVGGLLGAHASTHLTHTPDTNYTHREEKKNREEKKQREGTSSWLGWLRAGQLMATCVRSLVPSTSSSVISVLPPTSLQ